MSRRRMMAAFVCSLGGLTFGYDLGALSTVTSSLREQFHLPPFGFGVLISASLWGTMAGALVAGRIADRAGRKALIVGCAWLYLAAALGTVSFFSQPWQCVFAMRVICGLAIGGLTVGCPLYLAEIAPLPSRGRFVSLFQLQIGIGVVLAFTTGYLLLYVTQANPYWRWCLGLGACPAVLLLLLHRRLGSDAEWMPQKTLKVEDGQRERLFQQHYMKPLLLAACVALFNQLTGVNVLLIYLLEILSSGGIHSHLGHTLTIVISTLTLLVTVLSMACVDTLGRKPLIVLGSAGMAICLLGMGIMLPWHLAALLYVALLVAYNAFFALSQGTVVWVYLSELFPYGVRGSGQSYGTFIHWVANATLVSLFPLVEKTSQAAPFYFFALMMILQVAVALLWYPETNRSSLGCLEAVAACKEERQSAGA